MRSLRLVGFAAFTLLVACSSSPPPNGPTIDSISLPSSFTAANGTSGTTYTVQGNLEYHDDSGTVTKLHERIPMFGLDTTDTLNGTAGAPGTTSTILLTLGFTSTQAVKSGTVVQIELSVIDDDNLESNVEVQQIAVQ